MPAPKAHKGATADAKVIATTMLDLLQQPEPVESAWTYYREAQAENEVRKPFITKDDAPVIERNTDIMARYKHELSRYYYHNSKYETYLEQLGVDYPVLKSPDSE